MLFTYGEGEQRKTLKKIYIRSEGRKERGGGGQEGVGGTE